MIFNEPNFIDMTDVPKIFIYFLIDENNEVVYVGKTTTGLARVYAHHDKDYKRIFVIPYDYEELLDYSENVFIAKYLPKYNKTFNVVGSISISNVIKEIKKEFRLKKTANIDIHSILSELNISTYICSDVEYIGDWQLALIIDAIYKFKEGDLTNEVFNIGI